MRWPPPRGSLVEQGPRILEGNPIGVAPISWRPPPTDLDAFLSDLRRVGYDGIQLGETFPRGSELRALLSEHEMRLAEVYVALPSDPDGPAEDAVAHGRARLDLLEEGDGDVMVVALAGTTDRESWAGKSDLDRAPGLTEKGWSSLAGVLTALADEALQAGKTMVFHPHSGTYVESPAEVERLLDVTANSDMGICIDTGHDLVGGGDPVETLARVGERLRHIHLKDVDPRVLAEMREQGGFDRAIERRVFAPIGSGLLDLAGVLTHLAETGYRGWIMVEQDTTWEPPLEAAAISRRVLDWVQRQLG